MIRNIVSAVAASSVVYILSNYFLTSSAEYIERNHLIQIIIELRKKMYSTLRQIAYVANYLKVTEGDLQAKKIKDIMLRDGGTGDAKLLQIQEIIFDQHKISKQSFQQSCKHYAQTDIQVKLTLKKLQNDINLAIAGTIESYLGPLPEIDEKKTIRIYREVIMRRMHIIQERLITGCQNRECILLQNEIEMYLQEEGIYHKKEANEKVFLSLLQKHYKESSEFKWQLQELEAELQDCTKQEKRSTNKTQRRRP